MQHKKTMKKPVLGVTGATGTLGKRLVSMAIAAGWHVKCLARNPASGGSETDHLEWVWGDITQADSLVDFVQDLDAVVHLAAQVSDASAEEFNRVNVTGTGNLCEALMKHAPNCHLVYCSSIAVLRRYRHLTSFNTDYTQSKYHGELLVDDYRNRGLSVAYLYPGLIYGPEDHKLIPGLVSYLRKGQIFFLSAGERNAPLIYIDDICELVLQMIWESHSGDKYIGVGKQELGIHEFINRLADAVEVKRPSLKLPKHLLMPVAVIWEKLYQWLDKGKAPPLTRRAVDLLSINIQPELVRDYNRDRWHGETSVEQGLKSALQWCRERELV